MCIQQSIVPFTNNYINNITNNYSKRNIILNNIMIMDLSTLSSLFVWKRNLLMILKKYLKIKRTIKFMFIYAYFCKIKRFGNNRFLKISVIYKNAYYKRYRIYFDIIIEVILLAR